MVDITSWSGVAGIALLATFWKNIREFLEKIRSILVVKSVVSGESAQAIQYYALTTLRKTPFGDRHYDSKRGWVRPVGRVQQLCMERFPKQGLLFFTEKWIPLSISSSGGTSDSSGPNSVRSGQKSLEVTILSPRWLFDAEAFIIASLDTYNTLSPERYYINKVTSDSGNYYGPPDTSSTDSSGLIYEVPLKWSREDLGSKRSEFPFDSLMFSDEIMDRVREFEVWLKSEDWYKSRGLVWRRGWGIAGAPGVGKTSFIRALCQKFNLPIYAYDLSSMTNADFISYWTSMQKDVPCVALFEDIDGVFHGRENVTVGGGMTQKLSFDCLLNCLSGVETADGVFTIITTNDPSKLDPALGVAGEDGMSTRPGRLDRFFTMNLLNKEQSVALINKLLVDWPDAATEVAGVIPSVGISGAKVVELCSEVAMDRMFSSKI